MGKTEKKFIFKKLLDNKFIYSLISILILSICVPIVQTQIDKNSSRLDNYRFIYQQSMLKHSLSIEKYDLQRFLDLLLRDKYIEEKYNNTIFDIKNILNKRETELLADSITSTSLYPESSIDDYRNLRQKYNNYPLDKLRKIDIQQVENNILTIKNNIEKDINFWNGIRTLLYVLSILLFFIPVIRGDFK